MSNNVIRNAMMQKTVKEILTQTTGAGRGFSFEDLKIGIEDIREREYVLDLRLVEALEGFSGVEGYLIPCSGICGYNIYIGKRFESLGIGFHLSDVARIIDGEIHFIIEDVTSLDSDLIDYLTKEDVDRLVEIAPGLEPLKRLFEPAIQPKSYTLSDVAFGNVDIGSLTPLGKKAYQEDRFDIATIVAMAELNRPNDPVQGLRDALEYLEQ